MKNILLFTGVALLVVLQLPAQKDTATFTLTWDTLAVMPPSPHQNRQPGVAGAFTGVHKGVLIIAGGANFPDGPIWQGGTKEYQDAIYILEKADDDYKWFRDKAFSLPFPVAYGLSISTDHGLFCVGGMDESDYHDQVFLLRWNSEEKELIREDDWPTIPVPLANMSGGKIGDKLYVAGSSEGDGNKYFWSLDLRQPEKGWQALPVWDGPPRTYANGVVQNEGEYDCFYLMKGRYRGPNGISTTFQDMHKYDPRTNSWELIEATGPAGKNLAVSAATALPYGANHILLFGGAGSEPLNTLEQLAVDINAAEDSSRLNALTRRRDELLAGHSGFSRAVYAFHTITHTWTSLGELPSGSQVTTTALTWDDRIVIPTGEVAPSVRTPLVISGHFEHTSRFSWLNYAVLGFYLLLLVGLGFRFSRNQQTTDDFFRGGKRIPWWAAGLSIFGTQLSAITFMAIPAKTFATNWLYFILSMTIIMVAPFIIRYFLPFFRRFNLTSAYEYLELRFNLTTRLLGSMMYIFLQLGRVGIVLLLPSLALSVVTGIDVYLCILSMGVLSILYTVLGGIEAVIWTDVLQVVVLLGGALLSLAILAFNLNGQDIVNYIDQFDKLQVFDLSWTFTEPTLWVVLFGGLANNIVTYGSDQTVIQRYLTTKDEKTAAKGIMTGAWMTVPATLIFFSLGTLLFVNYKVHPETLAPALNNTDGIFPWYIINSLPDGVSGLLIAAVFAASMSSLDSSMNSVSTVLTTDFFRRLGPERAEATYLRLARWLTVVIGVVGTGLALVMAGRGVSSLWDQFNMIIGLFAGGLGGVFCLGIFFKRANGRGAIIGLIASGVVQYFVKEYTAIHLLLYAFSGMVTAISVGYFASLWMNGNDKDTQPYTLYSLSGSARKGALHQNVPEK